jgi:hypothetical protein
VAAEDTKEALVMSENKREERTVEVYSLNELKKLIQEKSEDAMLVITAEVVSDES